MAGQAVSPQQPAQNNGLSVYNLLRIKVRSVDRVGAVIDALATAGANRFNSISFQIENPPPCSIKPAWKP